MLRLQETEQIRIIDVRRGRRSETIPVVDLDDGALVPSASNGKIGLIGGLRRHYTVFGRW